MSYKFSRWTLIFKNFCIALLCVAIIVSLATIFDEAQPKHGTFASTEDIQAFLAEELGGDFANEDLSWLLDSKVKAKDEDLGYEYHRYSGTDSLGIWTVVEIWIIDGEVKYFYERDDVIKSLLPNL
jgi:hypothetical protein